MKTATIDDLQHRLAMIFTWLEAGEEVVVKPKAVKAVTTPPAEPVVDWTKSVVFQRPLSNPPLMSQAELDEFYEFMKGEY
jgi:hypothetical protein